MSNIPESSYKLEGNKMVISLNLTIPLQLEIDLQSIQDGALEQFNDYESLKTAINANSDLICQAINQEIIEEKVHVLSPNNELPLPSNNQEEKLVISLHQDSFNAALNDEDEPQSNQRVISNTKKKIKVCLADSLNDSLTLAVNIVGTMLFLGKLANYSWE